MIVTSADADSPPVPRVTVIVAVGGSGIVAGALYIPVAETMPHCDSVQPEPETFHFIGKSVSPITVAKNC